MALGDLVEEVGQLTGDAAGDLGEGEVGEGAVGEVEAVPGLDQPALGDAPGRAARSAGGSCRRRRRRRGGRRPAAEVRPDAEMPSVEHRCSSSASRPINSDVMWSILSGTTDIDISVDPVLLVGGRRRPVPLEATAPLAVADRLELLPRARLAWYWYSGSRRKRSFIMSVPSWFLWLTCRDSLPEVGPDIGTVPYPRRRLPQIARPLGPTTSDDAKPQVSNAAPSSGAPWCAKIRASRLVCGRSGPWLADDWWVRRGRPRCLCGACEPVGQHGGGGLPREPWIGAFEPERQTSDFSLPSPRRTPQCPSRARREQAMEVVHPRCAGLDISKKDAKVCVRVAGRARRKTARDGDDLGCRRRTRSWRCVSTWSPSRSPVW